MSYETTDRESNPRTTGYEGKTNNPLLRMWYFPMRKIPEFCQTLVEIMHEVIGAAMEVHRILGNGFQERKYEKD
jgi:hypothetical protein